MYTYSDCEVRFYELGDKVWQNSLDNCPPAIITECHEVRGEPRYYTASLDVSNNEEAYDDNGKMLTMDIRLLESHEGIHWGLIDTESPRDTTAADFKPNRK